VVLKDFKSNRSPFYPGNINNIVLIGKFKVEYGVDLAVALLCPKLSVFH
jgi:hypothetical protein